MIMHQLEPSYPPPPKQIFSSERIVIPKIAQPDYAWKHVATAPAVFSGRRRTHAINRTPGARQGTPLLQPPRTLIIQ
jgi:hypothetical protein